LTQDAVDRVVSEAADALDERVDRLPAGDAGTL
jgi:hypothetical protein